MSKAVKTRSLGFTLVEILIVVIILGILAAIVLPRFSNASEAARASMLADDLRILRTQVSVFKAQHQGVSPGYPDCDAAQAPDEASLVMAMTKVSKASGEFSDTRSSEFPYGPYLSPAIPENPINGKNTVEIIADDQPFPTSGDDSHGWVYQPSTLIVRPDTAGKDEAGKAFFEY